MSGHFPRFHSRVAAFYVGVALFGSPALLKAQNESPFWTRGTQNIAGARMSESAKFSPSSLVASLAWSPDGETLAVGGNGSISLYSKRGEVLNTYSAIPAALNTDGTQEKRDDPLGIRNEGTPLVTGLWWSPDGKSLAARFKEGGISVWDTENDKVRFVLGGHGAEILCLAWAPQCDVIAIGGVDTVITLFHASTGKLTKTLNGHLFPVRQLAFGATGDELVSLGIQSQYGPENTEIKKWSISKGTLTSEMLQDYGCSFSALSYQGKVCSLLPYRGTNNAGGEIPRRVTFCDTSTGGTISTTMGPEVDTAVVHLFSPSGTAFTTFFYGRTGYIGSQTWAVKGALPIMWLYQKPLTPHVTNGRNTTFLNGTAAISKNGMIATSLNGMVQVWSVTLD